MNNEEKIAKLQECINILDGIQHFKKKIKTRQDMINSFIGTFLNLRRKCENDIDTLNRCIVRLESRYEKLIKEL